MGKNEYAKKTYIDEKNDCEKETYLRELGNSVHNYIKTGVKNQQLDDLIDLEEQFKQKYQLCFDTKKIAEQISEISKDNMIEIVWEYKEKMDSLALSTDKINQFQAVEVSDRIYQKVVEKVYDKLNEIMRDAAYLSHMNMLYELYEKEEQLRREEEEYDRISEKYQKMADVLKNLSKQRHMELEQLQEQTELSKRELEAILSRNSKYFNMRKKPESIQISLSPSGRKYYAHVMDSQEKFSREASNQLIYKNCDSLMEALENSYNKGIECELKLEKLSPEREWAIQSKYHIMAQKFISDQEDMYTAKIFEIRTEKESVYKNNEKHRIRIPREWGCENN